MVWLPAADRSRLVPTPTVIAPVGDREPPAPSANAPPARLKLPVSELAPFKVRVPAPFLQVQRAATIDHQVVGQVEAGRRIQRGAATDGQAAVAERAGIAQHQATAIEHQATRRPHRKPPRRA
ncbi:hypothetical protein G6F32_016285 [Rhizopus arrhizus]|nr:hypothetical protein G6F32_016285 [Rhizopus arrhizus]